MKDLGAVVILIFLVVYGFWAVSFTEKMDKDFTQVAQRLATQSQEAK